MSGLFTLTLTATTSGSQGWMFRDRLPWLATGIILCDLYNCPCVWRRPWPMWSPESNPWEAAPPVPTRVHWVVHSSFTSHSVYFLSPTIYGLSWLPGTKEKKGAGQSQLCVSFSKYFWIRAHTGKTEKPRAVQPQLHCHIHIPINSYQQCDKCHPRLKTRKVIVTIVCSFCANVCLLCQFNLVVSFFCSV